MFLLDLDLDETAACVVSAAREAGSHGEDSSRGTTGIRQRPAYDRLPVGFPVVISKN